MVLRAGRTAPRFDDPETARKRAVEAADATLLEPAKLVYPISSLAAGLSALGVYLKGEGPPGTDLTLILGALWMSLSVAWVWLLEWLRLRTIEHALNRVLSAELYYEQRLEDAIQERDRETMRANHAEGQLAFANTTVAALINREAPRAEEATK